MQTTNYYPARGLPDSPPPRVRGCEQLKTIIEEETAVVAIVVAVIDVDADLVAVVDVVADVVAIVVFCLLRLLLMLLLMLIVDSCCKN